MRALLLVALTLPLLASGQGRAPIPPMPPVPVPAPTPTPKVPASPASPPDARGAGPEDDASAADPSAGSGWSGSDDLEPAPQASEGQAPGPQEHGEGEGPADGSGWSGSGEPGADAPTESEVLAPTDLGRSETIGTSRPRGELISGAPLENPDVAVHIVEKKRFADQGRHELTLFPVVPQANGKFTQHYGTGLSYQYHLQENFGLHLSGQYNWSSAESAFNAELIDKVKESALAASSLLVTWGAYAGFEVAPIYGKFAFYEGHLAQFSFVLSAGAGVASTRHQLVPDGRDDEGNRTPASFGDTGTRFLGEVGAGFRVQLGDRFALRLEVRDLVYTARVDRVNGCSLQDLDAVITGGSGVSGGCRAAAFDVGGNRTANLQIARDLVQEPSSDAVNLLNFYAGASFLF